MFESVSVQKPFEQVVAQIVRLIESGELSRGQRLPSESSLRSQFGVSTRVVREAVKSLEAMGLVEVRHGSGMYVLRDTVPAVTRAITLSLTPDERLTSSLLEVRLPLEMQSVRLAVNNATPEQLAAINQAAHRTVHAAETGDYVEFNENDVAFHQHIASASGNAYLRVILFAILPLVGELNEMMQRFPGSMAIAAGQHQQIADAILAGNGDAAEQSVREHVAYARKARESGMLVDADGMDPEVGA